MATICHRSISEALESANRGPEAKTASSEAADWLVDYLKQQGGSADSAEIRKEGLKLGHSKDAIYPAKADRGVISISEGFPRRAVWRSPVFAASGESATTTNTTNTSSLVVGA